MTTTYEVSPDYEANLIDRFDFSRPPNPLLSAAKYNRTYLSDVDITGGQGMAPIAYPMVNTMLRPMVSPLYRRMGQTTLDQRRWGHDNVWQETILAKHVPESVDGPLEETFLDADQILDGIERLGFYWDLKLNTLNVFISRANGITTVRVPASKVKAIFAKSWQMFFGSPFPEKIRRRERLGDIFSDIGNFFTKEIPKAVNNVTKGVGSFFKNPGKWLKSAGKDLGKFASQVGKVASDVASSEIFAGVMGAIAVIPPLQAVGGAGLAAYGVAKTAKTIIDTAKPVLDVAGKALSKPKKSMGSELARQVIAHAKAQKAAQAKAKAKAKAKPKAKTISKEQKQVFIKKAVDDLSKVVANLRKANSPHANLILAAMKSLPA